MTYFAYERLYYSRYCQLTPDEICTTPGGARVSVNAIVQTLREQGIVAIPAFYADATMDALARDLLAKNDEVRAGRVPTDNNVYSDRFSYSSAMLQQGIIRIHNINQQLATPGLFAKNELLRRVGELYLGRPIVRKATLSQYNERGRDEAKTWHVDFYMNLFKAFLYVTDVTADNGPLLLLPGSHAVTWKNVQRLYRHLDDEIVPQSEAIKTGYVPTTYPAAKGTVLLMDPRTIHQGGHVRSGHRLVLVNYYWTATH